MASAALAEAIAASELREDQVLEQAEQAAVPVQDDAGPLDGQGLLDHDLDYIMEIPAHHQRG